MRSVPVEARKRAQAKTMRFLIKDLSQLLWSLMYVSRNSPKRLNLVVSCKPKALSALWNNCITGVDGKKSQEFANSLAIFGFHDHVTRWFEFIRQGKVSGPEVSELPELMKTLFLLPDGTIRSGLELFLQQVREFKYADPQQTIDLFVFQKQQINFLDMTDCYMLHLN